MLAIVPTLAGIKGSRLQAMIKASEAKRFAMRRVMRVTPIDPRPIAAPPFQPTSLELPHGDLEPADILSQ